MTNTTLHHPHHQSDKNTVVMVVILFIVLLSTFFTEKMCCDGLSFVSKTTTTKTTTTTTIIKVATYDVFASKQFAGNQLAVFTDLPDDLPTEKMQQLVSEMNYAESTFLFKKATKQTNSDSNTAAASTSQFVPSNQFQYRIFTPEFELPFAGHPTLGTAYHAIKHVLHNPTEESSTVNSVLLECKGGTIPVTMDKNVNNEDDDEDDCSLLWMEQQPPKFQRNVDIQRIATALQCDIEFFDKNYPCQVYSTGGTPFLIVPVTKLSALSQIHHPGPSMFPFCHDEINVVGIYLVTREGHDDNTHTISARSMIAETAVPEDPATGSACGCFAGWAIENGYVESSSFVVGQGYEMGRPSLLHVNVAVQDDDDNANDDTAPKLIVKVGGMVIPVIEGGQITLR